MFKTLVVFPETSISVERLISHAGSVSSRNGSSGACPLRHRRATMGSSRTGKGIGSVKVMRMEKSMVSGVGLRKEAERRTNEDLARIGWPICRATRALLYSFQSPDQFHATRCSGRWKHLPWSFTLFPCFPEKPCFFITISCRLRCIRFGQALVIVIVAVTADEVVTIRPGFLRRAYGVERGHDKGNGNNVAFIMTFPDTQQDK